MGEGYGALLKDAEASMVFVDRDLTRWQGPSTQEQIDQSGSYNAQGAQVAADPTSSLPALACMITGAWGAAPGLPLVEAWYDAGPNNVIGSLYYAWQKNAITDNTDTHWNWFALLANQNHSSGWTLDSTGNLRAAGPGTGTLTATASNRRFGLLQLYYTVAAGSSNSLYAIYWTTLAVYGNHGLTGRGASPTGFYPSDIFGWALAQVPGLQTGTVQQTDSSGFIIPHYVQYLPVTLDVMVTDMATIQGWHWGVWESQTPLTGSALPRADFRPRPAPGAFTAFCLRRDCSTLDIREDLTNQFNNVVVNFSQADGTSGVATATADNPILDQAGIQSKTVIFQGGTMTPATAATFGAEALAITNAQARVAGTAEIISPLDGGTRPAWLLKAGIDRLRIGDVPSTGAWGGMSDFPIVRVEASISSSGFNTSVEFGSGADLIETLQSRLAAATALSAQGGI